VAHLAGKVDRIFLPFFLEESEPDSRARRMYCHYTQYASALAGGVDGGRIRERCISPLLSFSKWKDRTSRELFEELSAAGVPRLTPKAVARAFDRALAAHEAAVRRLQKRYLEEMAHDDARGFDGAGKAEVQPHVVLIGRPYTALSPEMSKGIPEIFGSLGVKCFFQDMIPYTREEVGEASELLEAVHWKYAAKNLEVACIAARTPGLYPVFVTSFKCSPDSFALEYFKRILDSHDKPYLVLQLDDHDSAVGYETRIEAGVASFRNHARRRSTEDLPCATFPSPAAERVRARQRAGGRSLPVNPRLTASLAGRTLLLPVWDQLLIPLVAACLRREGIDTRVLREDPVLIRSAMRHNTGQCIPLNIIAEEAAAYVRANGLDPERTSLWLPKSGWSCNIAMFPFMLKSLFESFGGGMERMAVYSGDLSLQEISLRASLSAFRAAVVAGLLRRVGCRLRPYETRPGATDTALRAAMELLIPAFEGRASRDAALRSSAALFAAVEVQPVPRPKAAIFGDFYVRDNDVFNQGLVQALEKAGGEVITTPFAEYYRIVIGSYFRKWLELGDYRTWLSTKVIWTMGEALAVRCRSYFDGFLEPDAPVGSGAPAWMRGSFGVRIEHSGEAADNLHKVFHLAHAHPDLHLFVQASPAFCCPSLITEAMSRTIEKLTGVPVVSITYDGTGEYRNDVFEPWLRTREGALRAPSALSLPS
jgi:predicted nucleotide-binding protein (sugar kinase/HSP70/actin superfamily)